MPRRQIPIELNDISSNDFLVIRTRHRVPQDELDDIANRIESCTGCTNLSICWLPRDADLESHDETEMYNLGWQRVAGGS